MTNQTNKAAQSPNNASDDHKTRMQALRAEQREKVRQRTIVRGVIVVNTGNGKGKSTAAFGLALRAVGHGQKVALVQFIKGKWKTGEREVIARFPEIEHVISGQGFTWETQDRERDQAAARAGWEKARSMIENCRGTSPPYQLVILDELNVALRYGQLPLEEVLQVLKNKPEALNIVVTGRDAPAKLIDLADTVTDMTPVKHAFEAGIRAQRGIEF